MLSNPNPSLYRQQRQHRRQNSTPTAFEAPKIPLLPATKLQRLAFHRRGQSLDQRTQQTRQQQFPQDDNTVSITPGFQSNQQHTLRATQQHRPVQPGQQQQRFSFPVAQDFEAQCQEDTDESFKQQCAYYSSLFLGQSLDGIDSQNAQIPRDCSGSGDNNESIYLDQNAIRSTTAAGYPGGFGLGLDEFLRLGGNGGNMGEELLGMPLGDVDCDSRIGVMHQDWSESQQGPTTPSKQTSSAYYPLTPAKTPHSRVPQTAPPRRNTEASSPSLNTKTIKASRVYGHRRAQSTRDIFSNGHFGGDTNGLPSPPNSTPLPARAFDIAPMPHPNFMSMESLNVDFNGSDNGYDSSHYSPKSSALSPALSSLRSSAEPESSRMTLFDNPLNSAPDPAIVADTPSPLVPPPSTVLDVGELSGAEKPSFSPRAKSMPMPDLNIDASIKETGITIDDIASFIRGPDPLDGKWMCLYPDCNKRFGRKENIKSHIQTHLGDRQFICNHCNKCFVRQHDLKRHAKIHSGVKPYPCLCGNHFARHDALTRHRQRGMCIGAFKGIVKKPIKRGRPRKTRPDEEERLDKAARTRKAVTMSTTSSSSGFSDQSNVHSPPGSQDLGAGVSSPFNTLLGYLSNSDSSRGMSPDMLFHTPPSSPNRELDNYVSPQHTQYSLSPARRSPSVTLSPKRRSTANASGEGLTLPSSLSSPAQGLEDVYATPPGLSHLSSSPPRSAGSPAEETRDKSEPNSFTLPGISEDPDEIFGSSFSALEGDPDALLMPEFDKLFFNNDVFQDACDNPDEFFGNQNPPGAAKQKAASTFESLIQIKGTTTALYLRRCAMARLRNEHEESDDEFPDISIVISRFYQNKLSKPPNEEQSRVEEPDRMSVEGLQTPRYGDCTASAIELMSSTSGPSTPTKTPNAKSKFENGSLAKVNAFPGSPSEDESLAVLKYSPPRSRVAKDSPTKYKPPAQSEEISKERYGQHEMETPQSGRRWKSQPISKSRIERSVQLHTPGKPKPDRNALNAKKTFNEGKHILARDFLKELDDRVCGGQIESITASTGGVKLIWSKKLTTTAARANWRKEKVTELAMDEQLGSSGQSTSYRHIASIELSEKVIDDENRLLNALSHEYCHLANFMVSGVLDHPHGESFKAWAKICTRTFGHRGIEVTTKHSYAIDYKYIWECTGCGVHFKRHSKSVDPARHACGSCKSKLIQIQPAPRNAALSEYQLFVKENFREVKKANPLSPQKEIMGLLGAAYKRDKGASPGSEGDLDPIASALKGLSLRDP